MIGEYFRGAFLKLAGGQREGLLICKLTQLANATHTFIDTCLLFGNQRTTNVPVLDP